MSPFFGRRQDEFRSGQVTWVDIERPCFGKSSRIGHRLFPGIGLNLHRRQLRGVEPSVEQQKHLLEPLPHVGFIVSSVVESKRRAHMANFSESRRRLLLKPSQLIGIATEGSHDQLGLVIGANRAHRAVFLVQNASF